jgi:hypothetical protein
MKLATNVLVFQLGSLFVDELLLASPPSGFFCPCGSGFIEPTATLTPVDEVSY